MWWLLRLLGILGGVTSFAIPKLCVPRNVTRTHDSMAELLNLRQPEVSANPLFNHVIRNASCQRQDQVLLMHKTLDVYIHIFSSILRSGEGPGAPSLLGGVAAPRQHEAEAALRRLKVDMQQLKADLNSSMHGCEDGMSQLQRVKVNDTMDQRRALAQFKEVYKAASLLLRPSCKPIS